MLYHDKMGIVCFNFNKNILTLLKHFVSYDPCPFLVMMLYYFNINKISCLLFILCTCKMSVFARNVVIYAK